MSYSEMELHLGPSPLSRSQAKRIKDSGGKYSECRGYSMTRFVTVPASEHDLINELVREHTNSRKTVMIARGDERLPSWVIVQEIDPQASEPPVAQFERKYQAAKQRAKVRGLVSV